MLASFLGGRGRSSLSTADADTDAKDGSKHPAAAKNLPDEVVDDQVPCNSWHEKDATLITEPSRMNSWPQFLGTTGKLSPTRL